MLREAESRWAGDAIVVGAGVAGTLIASQLAAAGLDVTLVEADGYGAGQSNHSHGYLHRGYIYHQPSPTLVEALGRGADEWIDMFHAAGCEPLSEHSTVAFTNPVNAMRASSNWRAADLPVVVSTIPADFREGLLVSAFHTREPTYDLTPWFTHAKRELLSQVRTIRGSCVRMLHDRGTITALQVRRAGVDLALRAYFYVVAAGIGNIDLIEAAAQVRGRALNRTSLMLVIEADLPRQSVVIPDHEAYGLFVVSRPSPTSGRSVWLVSNYISYASGINSVLAVALWIRGVGRTLRRFTQSFDGGDFNWSVYPAPKAELRPDPRVLAEHSTESYGFSNCLVASPSKLTLAPLLAERVASEVLTRIVRRQQAESSALDFHDDLPVHPERWKAARWRRGPDLLRLLDHDDIDLEDALEVDPAEPLAEKVPVMPEALESDGRPRIFISYSHDSPRWREAVIEFADALARLGGLDVELDVYDSPAGREWGAWGAEQVRSSDFVVCLGSPQYVTRWNMSFGSGVANEARAIRSRLDQNPGAVIFVLLPGRTKVDLPEDVRNVHHVSVDGMTSTGLESLLRIIYGRPQFAKPRPGPIPPLRTDYVTDEGSAHGEDR